MIIDPICGLTVDESTELRAHRDGMTVYFCSDRCREKFLSAPELERAGMMLADTAVHTCPRHPEVWQVNPDDCPKCHMESQPDSMSARAADRFGSVTHVRSGGLGPAGMILRHSWVDSQVSRWMRFRHLFGIS